MLLPEARLLSVLSVTRLLSVLSVTLLLSVPSVALLRPVLSVPRSGSRYGGGAARALRMEPGRAAGAPAGGGPDADRPVPTTDWLTKLAAEPES